MSVPPYLRRKQAQPIGAAGRSSEKQLTRPGRCRGCTLPS